MEHVRVEQRDAVAIVTLVDAARRNAMTAPMVDEIVATFDALEADGTTVGAVVITGEPPAFCSGADVVEPRARSQTRPTIGERRSVVSIYEGFLRVLRSPLPTVAAVNGPAVGAGMNLALACDVRVAGTFGPLRHTVREDRPASRRRSLWMLERAVGPQAAAAMVLFGAPVDGPRAVEIGLAWSCHPDEDLLARTVEFAAGAAAASRPAARTGEGNAAGGAVAARLRRRGRDRSRPPGLVARPRLVPSPVSPASGEPRRMSALTR